MREAVFQDVTSHCKKASCDILNQNDELLPEEEVLADLQLKIHDEWRSDQFSVTSIQILIKYQTELQEIRLALEKGNSTLCQCHDVIVKTRVVAMNTHEPDPDELQKVIQKFDLFVSSRVAT